MNIDETTNGLDQRSIPELAILPRPVYARVEDIAERRATQAHSHPWVQLSYAIRGVLKIRSKGGVFVAPPQMAILIPPKLEHVVENSPGTQMRSLYIATEALPDTGHSCEVLAVSDLLREAIRHFSLFPVEYDETGPQGRLAQVMLDLVAAAPRKRCRYPGRKLPVCGTSAQPSWRRRTRHCSWVSGAKLWACRSAPWSGSFCVRRA